MPKNDLPKLSFKPAPALPIVNTNEQALAAKSEARLSSSAKATGFADHLRVELSALIAYEMEITVQVGVMTAAGVSQGQICHALGIDSSEFKMCKRRLQQVAREWMNDD